MNRGHPTRDSGVTEEQVILVDPHGQVIGTRAKAEVHTEQTPLHIAFSLHLFAPDSRVLLTRRALSKATWPGCGPKVAADTRG